MSVQHYFDLLREIRDTSMATVAEDGTPRVRNLRVCMSPGGGR